jgi:hypothetical protein
MTTKSLVLCRYNEDVNWIKQLQQDEIEIFIYDKGEQLQLEQFNLKKIKSDNVGREAHAYIHHIVENYDNLTDQIYFSQADPFSPLTGEKESYIPNYIEELKNQMLKSKIDNGFKWIGRVTDNGLQMDYGSQIDNISGHPNPYKRSMKNIYESVFDKECPLITNYYIGGFFFVERNNVLNHSLDQYKKLLDILSYPEQKEFSGFWKSNPFEAHLLEKMYGTIFGNKNV